MSSMFLLSAFYVKLYDRMGQAHYRPNCLTGIFINAKISLIIYQRYKIKIRNLIYALAQHVRIREQLTVYEVQ